MVAPEERVEPEVLGAPGDGEELVVGQTVISRDLDAGLDVVGELVVVMNVTVWDPAVEQLTS